MLFRLSAATAGRMINPIARARQFTKPGENVLWFRQNDREYIVRDPATLRDLETLWRPQAVIRVVSPATGGQPATPEPASALTEAEKGRIRRELDAKLKELQTALDAVIVQLQRDKPSDLDDRISALGQQMETLGRDIQNTRDTPPILTGQVRQASRSGAVDTRMLMDRAIAKGLATAIR
jgi:hypothetical protein